MTKEELNFIKDAFSQIIDDIAGNPDWGDAAKAVASDLGTLERKLEKRVTELPSNLDEAADTFAHNGDVNGVGGDDYEDDLRITFKAGAEWMAGQGVSLSHLIAWYIQSVDDHEPVWTKEHLEELVKDYILIPKK